MIAAVLGGGRIGQRHAHNFARLGYAVRVWDLFPTRSTVRSCASALDGAGLVIIATPPASHLELAEAAIDAGARWLLIEKPLAPDAHEAAAFAARVPPDVQIIVGYCLRFALATQRLRALLPALGTIRVAEGVYSARLTPEQDHRWLHDPLQGGVALEHSHLLDLLLLLWGPPRNVWGSVSLEAVCGVLEWDTHAATIRMDWCDTQDTHLRIVGTHGTAVWQRESLLAPGVDAADVESPRAWLLHEAQALHTAIMTGAPTGGATVADACQVLTLIEELGA